MVFQLTRLNETNGYCWLTCNILVNKIMCLQICQINMLITVYKDNMCMLKYQPIAKCRIKHRWQNLGVLETVLMRKAILFGDKLVYPCKHWIYLFRFCLFKIHQHPQQQCIISSKQFLKKYSILPDCSTKHLSVEVIICEAFCLSRFKLLLTSVHTRTFI